MAAASDPEANTYEANAYDEIARRFFNQFLELKLELNSGAAVKPRNWDKEEAHYKTVIAKLKSAAQEFAEDNQRIEEALALAEDEKADLRRQLNESTVNLGLAMEKLSGLGVVRQEAERTGYSFVEHMSGESKRAWEQIMQEIPRPGHDV